MQDDRYFVMALFELILIHLLGVASLFSFAAGMTSATIVTGISYVILLALILFYFMNGRFAQRIREHTIIEGQSAVPFLLLVSLLFYILCMGIGANAATMLEAYMNGELEELLNSLSLGPAFSVINALLNFFIFFIGALTYVVLATGRGTKESLEILNFRITKLSALYFLAGVPAALAFSYGLDYLTVSLQGLLGFQLGENAVAIGQVQGMNIPLAFMMAALTALGEELFFRGFLQNRGGVLFTSVIFTLSHISYGSAYEIVAAFLFSLIMGYAVRRTKDLGFSVGMHFTNNFAVAIMVNYFPHLAGI